MGTGVTPNCEPGHRFGALRPLIVFVYHRTLADAVRSDPNLQSGQKMSPSHAQIPYRKLSCWLLVLMSCACGGPASDPEVELRAWVTEGEEAAEAKDRRALLDKISENYADARGNNRDDIGNLFRVYMLRQQSVAILTKIDQIELLGDTAANIALTVGMAGTGNRAFGLNADAYRFELELEKQGGSWLLIGARWGEVGSELR